MSVCDQRFPQPMLLAEGEAEVGCLCLVFVLGAESQSSLFPGVAPPAGGVPRSSVSFCSASVRELTDNNSIYLTPTGVSLLSALAGSPVLRCRQCVPV